MKVMLLVTALVLLSSGCAKEIHEASLQPDAGQVVLNH